MKKTVLLFLCLLSLFAAVCQSISPNVLNSTGSTYSSNSLALEWNIGEIATTTLVNGNIITQGLLQPLIVSNGPLPVKWIYFKATPANNVILLEWKTAQEINNDHFDVERSKDGIQFSFIQKIAGNGSASQPQIYTSRDPSPFKNLSYYRLKQVDFDGNVSYSAIVPVKMIDRSDYKLFPNPASNSLTIERQNSDAQSIIEIVDASGKTIKAHVIKFNETQKALNIQSLARGIYFIKVTNSSSQWVQQFAKQ